MRKKTRKYTPFPHKKVRVFILSRIFLPITGLLAVLVFGVVLYLHNFLFAPCANSISCIKDLTGNYEPDTTGVFMGQTVTVPSYIAVGNELENRGVLGESTGDNKHIYVDLTSQTLYAKEGDNTVLSFPISSGKWYPTPTGDFRIWIKLRYTRMSGGNPAIGTYYNLPNVPFTMYYANNKIGKSRGFSLHGAYWHNNFGHPMSHGCVNISIPNAEMLYNWANPPTAGSTTYATAANPGTPVTVYGVTPRN